MVTVHSLPATVTHGDFQPRPLSLVPGLGVSMCSVVLTASDSLRISCLRKGLPLEKRQPFQNLSGVTAGLWKVRAL